MGLELLGGVSPFEWMKGRVEEAVASVTRSVEQLAAKSWVEVFRPIERALDPGPFSPVPTGPPSMKVDAAKGASYGAPPGGTPFVQGRGDASDISWNDVSQGALGDCYFMASVAAVARTDPERIRKLIHDNGDGSYTVTLHERQPFWSPREFEPVQIRVTPDFPMRDGKTLFAQTGEELPGQRELWVALLEKAFATYAGGYGKIESGLHDHGLELLTGVPSENRVAADTSLRELQSLLSRGDAVTVSTHWDWAVGGFDMPDVTDRDPLYRSGALVSGHVYFLESVDLGAGTVTVRNPWGPQTPPVVLTEAEFRRALLVVASSPLRGEP